MASFGCVSFTPLLWYAMSQVTVHATVLVVELMYRSLPFQCFKCALFQLNVDF